MGGLGHGGTHTSRYVGAACSNGGVRACKGQAKGEGRRAYRGSPGHIAWWRGASKHLIEEGIESGGGFRATVACHNIKSMQESGPACRAVAGQNCRVRDDPFTVVHNWHAARARGFLVRVRRAGCEAAISPRWRDTQEVVKAVFHRWPSLSKSTTCHGRRAGERGEQAGAQAQPRAWALSPHGQPVRRAGRGKVLATRHRCEQKMQASQPRAPSEKQRNVKGGGAQCE